MVKITRLNGSTTDITELSYNGLDQLIQVKDTGIITRDRYYLWCEGRICEERDQNNAVTRRFSEHGYRVEGGSPASYFYTRDHLGSVREITNSSGTVVARYEYDPFGKLTQTLGTVAPPFGYAGYFYHAETGLNLTYYRAYDPRIGRWLTRDPIGERGGQNLYGYVGNSPSNAVDPLGLVPGDWFSTADQAAADAIQYTLQHRMKLGNGDYELAGWIYESTFGYFSYTSPLFGKDHSADPGPKPVFLKAPIGIYHTHTCKSMRDTFSPKDRQTAVRGNVTVYMGDPRTGSMLSVDPNGIVTTLPGDSRPWPNQCCE